ncbi:MAG: 23S rRNA (uracil(1939)-C(5))-methyltransferase RlmD [Gammaproteobacteria bacterium]
MSGRRHAPRRSVDATPIETEVERLSHEGRGVARVAGKTVFIEGALPDERVRMRYTRRHGQYDEGVLLEVLRASPERIAPRCAHFERCGGCSLQHLSSAAQIAHKQAVLLELLEHQADVVPMRVLPPLTAEPWAYRRRARLSVRYVFKREELLIGFREKHSHYVTDLRRCETLVPAVGTRLVELRALLGQLSCAADIPQIEIAAGDDEVALLVRHLRPLSEADRERLRSYAAASGLRIYAQAGAIDSLERLDGPPAPLAYEVDGLRLEFLPGDFVQVNAAMNRVVVPLALELLDLGSADRVLDLFCGLGNFTLPLARRAAAVVGIEGDAGLVARAAANAARLDLEHARFLVANLFEAAGIAAIPREAYTRVLLDPPRSGAAELLEAFDFRGVARVCYVSCNPVTLARDAAVLVRRHGYRLEAAGVLDMFPHTTHVESIASFVRE